MENVLKNYRKMRESAELRMEKPLLPRSPETLDGWKTWKRIYKLASGQSNSTTLCFIGINIKIYKKSGHDDRIFHF
jgi:hypothetical protein